MEIAVADTETKHLVVLATVSNLEENTTAGLCTMKDLNVDGCTKIKRDVWETLSNALCMNVIGKEEMVVTTLEAAEITTVEEILFMKMREKRITLG